MMLLTLTSTTRYCANLLAGFLARDCYEGIRTCDLCVSVSEATEGQKLDVPRISGPKDIASLLVAQWLGLQV
jgi:hypothetical protein